MICITVKLSVRKFGVTEQTHYRWRTEYRGLSLDRAKKLKRLEKEHRLAQRQLRNRSCSGIRQQWRNTNGWGMNQNSRPMTCG